MTRQRKGPVTVAEAIAELNADPDWVARRKAEDQEREARSSQLRIEQQPLLAELRSVGWEVNSVWDLVNTGKKYEEAIPVLLKHLVLPYSDRIRGGIARSLAVRYAPSAWPILVAEYRKEPTCDDQLGAKCGLAVALAATATRDVIEELATLARDRSQGISRAFFISSLKRSKTAVAKEALRDLASDPELRKEVLSLK
jgi:hypothetical protein